jgi:hypothetical protein
MSALYRYFLIVVACASILLGIQIPNFINQYEQRLDAHFREVKNNLRGYQEIAEQYFGGSLEALIEKHEQDPDPAFKQEAGPIRNIYQRYLRFLDEKSHLKTNFLGKALFVLVRGDRELFKETRANYSFSVPLDRPAVLTGSLCAALALFLVEVLKWGFFRLLRRIGFSTGRAGLRL